MAIIHRAISAWRVRVHITGRIDIVSMGNWHFTEINPSYGLMCKINHREIHSVRGLSSPVSHHSSMECLKEMVLYIQIRENC